MSQSAAAPTVMICVGVWCTNVQPWGYHTGRSRQICAWMFLPCAEQYSYLNAQVMCPKKNTLPSKLTEVVELLIMQLVLQYVGITLTEIRKEVHYMSGVDLSVSTICQFLRKHNFSRQRIRLIASQRDEVLRQVYANEVLMYKADMIIFVDETGTDARDKIRKYGYGVRGKPPVAQKLLVRGQHFSSIAIMSTAGVLDFQVVTGSVTGDVFEQFVQYSILPHLMPFNGTNQHSIVVMDNASIHHVDGITDLIQGVGAIPLFLPPYSPDFNPIEEFSKLKTTIKTYEFQDVQLELESIIYSAFCHITPEDCNSWIAHPGIYPMN